MARMFIASLATETNAFVPFPTGMAAFTENRIIREASRAEDSYGGSVLAVVRRLAEADGHAVIESITAFAQPAGKTVRGVYEELRDMIVGDLRAAGPVDMILLMLHGAMVADGYDDCEADLVERLRALVPGAVIGVELDPHCHLSGALVAAADMVIPMKEYPHIDGPERAEEMYRYCEAIRTGSMRPVAALVDTRMIGFYPTFDEPMRSIVAHLREVEGRGGVISASIAHGFPWADVADVGTRVLVYADGDAALASAGALEMAEHLYRERETLLPRYPGITESLDRAAGLHGRVVLGDYSDNPGGGAPGDSTFFLREILNRGLEDVAIGSFHDPAVARIAADAGPGARLAIRLGGKAGPVSGDPIDLDVEVIAVREQFTQQCFDTRWPMGLAVSLRHRGVEIAVNDLRAQTYSTDMFTGLDIDLATKKLVVVKSSTHFEHSFAAVTDHGWRVVSPGVLNLDLGAIAYTKRDPHFFPREPDPWATAGAPQPQIFAGRP